MPTFTLPRISMLHTRFATVALYSLALFVISLAGSGCRKDKQQAATATRLQHKWMLKSTSDRFSITGSYQSQWKTTQVPAGYYREFKSDGTWTESYPGFSLTEPYQLRSDSILILQHPATVTRAYADPDTAFIRQLNDSVFVWYRRHFFISPNYAKLEEKLDTLVR